VSAEAAKDKNRSHALYIASFAIGFVGLSYAAVPLYQAFCQATGYGGTIQKATVEKFKTMKPVENARPITIHFNADTSDTMPWEFQPEQNKVKIVPGETALAFYKAFNPAAQPVTGVSTYNVTPMKAGVYFNKIQCFCFEEQRLRPREEIDMPIFFYVDPEFADDPSMADVREITLSYTFFRTGKLDATTGEYFEEEGANASSATAQGRPSLEPTAAASQADAVLPEPAKGQGTAEDVAAWTRQMVKQTGVSPISRRNDR
jgi:cytochrome c oxidase assembly protein subunit 11